MEVLNQKLTFVYALDRILEKLINFEVNLVGTGPDRIHVQSVSTEDFTLTVIGADIDDDSALSSILTERMNANRQITGIEKQAGFIFDIRTGSPTIYAFEDAPTIQVDWANFTGDVMH